MTMLMGILSYLGDKLGTASSKVLGFGKSTKSKVQDHLASLLGKLGIKWPKRMTAKKEIKLIKELREDIDELSEERIQELEGELSTKVSAKAHGAFDYTIENKFNKMNIKNFLRICKVPQRKNVEKHIPCKVNYTLNCEMSRDKLDGGVETIPKDFKSTAEAAQYPQHIPEIYNKAGEEIISRFGEFMQNGSGWRLTQIISLDIHITPYTPSGGRSYIPLPKFLAKKRALINPKNDDEFCLKYAITISLHKDELGPHPERITKKLLELVEQYNWNDIDFTQGANPVKVIKIFEKNNPDVRLFIRYVEEDTGEIVKFPPSLDRSRTKKADILYFRDKDDNEHFAAVSRLSALLRSQVKKKINKKLVFCDFCDNSFTTVKAKEKHEGLCSNLKTIRVRYPERDEDGNLKTLRFEKIENQVKLPMIIVADFEALLLDCDVKTKATKRYNVHKASKCGFNVIREDGKNEYFSFSGENCATDMIKKIEEVQVSFIEEYYKREKFYTKDRKGEKVLTDSYFLKNRYLDGDEEVKGIRAFNDKSITDCYLCKRPITEDDRKVRDHCHFTGKFRGVAHNKCNLRTRVSKLTPVLFHNLNYDKNLFIRELAKNLGMEFSTNVIGKSSEKFVSFSKKLKVYEDVIIKGKATDWVWEIRFLDTCSFFQFYSLEDLVANLKKADKEKFREIRKWIDSIDTTNPSVAFDLMTQKGLYPYRHAKSFDVFEETEIPPMSAFDNDLTCEKITEEDYKKVHQVYEVFKIKNFSEYTDLYLKSDVLLLADVVNEFRDKLYFHYRLDPFHSYTLPGFSWQCMLKETGVKLDLFAPDQSDICVLYENGIRGGVSTIIHRYSKSNNKYKKDYKKDEEDIFIKYLDANNLYGWAMMQALPTGDFKWMSPHEIKNWKNFLTKEGRGCTLCVDLQYPKKLHDDHKDLPCAPEKFKEKLIPHLGDRKNYVVHYRLLKKYLDLGLKIKKIHYGVSFTESEWMRPYIEKNSELRKNAKNDFEKDLFKLLNNAVFGKTMECIRKYINLKLVSNEKEMDKYGSWISFKGRKIVEDDGLTIAEFNQMSVYQNKVVYVGQSILDISKILMYDFHYNYIKKKYGDKAQLLFTDTDSLCYEIKTPDFYFDIKDDVENWFDTSNYSKEHPAVKEFGFPVGKNKKVPGFFKDECGGKEIIEFAGTSSKCYAYLKEDDKEPLVKKAKGIRKPFLGKKITFEDYKACVLEKKEKEVSQNLIRSHDLINYTECMSKIALNPVDTKRYVLKDGIRTLPFGHWRIA